MLPGSLIAGSLACLFAPPAYAAYQVELSAPAPLRKLLTEHLDLFRFRERDDIGTDQLNYMAESVPEAVARLAATEGYFSPETKVTIGKDGEQPVVYVRVLPGPRTRVTTADVSVSGAAREKSPRQAEQVSKEWELRPGAPFRQPDWAAAKQSGLQILQRRRYPAASIADSQVRVYADEQQAEIAVIYDSGPLFTLGSPVITGTKRYPESIVRNVSPLRVGEEYSVDRLLEYQRQILRTPYYSNAVVEIEKDPAKAELAPVNVRVTEFPVQRIRTGIGYSTDTGAHLNGRYSHNNIFDRAWVLDSQLRLEQRLQSGMLDLAMPPDSRAFVNSAHASIERTTLEGIDLRSRRIGVRRARATDRRDSAYFVEYYRDRLEQQDGAAPPADIVIEPGSHQALMAGTEQTWRRLDDPIFPRQGRILTAQAGMAFKGLLTDQTFFRLYGRLNQYVPIGARDLLLVRGELGAVITKGGNAAIPASLLFRAGGTDSVRGYSFQSIGNERNGVVYPARYLATGSVEYQHWLTEAWGAAIFYDVGMATDRWSGKSFFHAVGAGARWRSPVGRVRVDLAYGFQQNKLRPHLSLGVAF